ncbi:hypothetical protein MOE90_20845 [Bacillus spizizenii]|nr:hypothetical protein [Bacillus spizizenii]MCY9125041.1 hypothetical protein [Bacillus spizizenii]
MDEVSTLDDVAKERSQKICDLLNSDQYLLQFLFMDDKSLIKSLEDSEEFVGFSIFSIDKSGHEYDFIEMIYRDFAWIAIEKIDGKWVLQ